jgi:hypothetical protein
MWRSERTHVPVRDLRTGIEDRNVTMLMKNGQQNTFILVLLAGAR